MLQMFFAKITFANLHFTHTSFYQTFWMQTYKLTNILKQSHILPNIVCQPESLQIFWKTYKYPSFCQPLNGAAIVLGQVRLSSPQGLDSARSAGVETCQVQLAQVRCNWPRLGEIGSGQVQLAQVRCYWPIQELEHQIRGSECY